MSKSNIRVFFLAAMLFCILPRALAIEFVGVPQCVLEYEVPATSGLSAVYVLSSTENVTISYRAANPGSVRWYSFNNLGGGFAQEIPVSVSGADVSVKAAAGDMGYIIEEGSARLYFWVTDYSAHELALNALNPAPDRECGHARFSLDGSAGEIPYFGINGRRFVLSRELKATYNTLEFDESSFVYVQKEAVQTLASASADIAVEAPLCDTSVRLSGDRFLAAWGREVSVESPVIPAMAVACQTRATQSSTASDNQQRTEGAELGGSAPCDVTFEAAVTDGAVFREWQISRDSEFGILENTFSDLVFDYTFREQGRTFVRFICDNSSGTCQADGPTYEIFIGESKLDIPNAFSPEGSPGVNDLWKVSYRSLVSYECHIFNRYGKELFSTTDPAEGWDGRSGGKYVPSGVYFYVIKAVGADGVKYDRAGDINIIKYSPGLQPSAE